MVRQLFARFGSVLRDGFRIWWLAPLVPALVAVPEAIQHVVEIRIGMFESREAFTLLAGDPRRMAWGYPKVAGLLLAILATVRFLGTRNRKDTWWDLRDVAWKNLLIAVALIAASIVPGLLLEGSMGADAAEWVHRAFSLAILPLLPLMVLALAGDNELSLRRAYRLPGWVASLRLLVFVAIIWLPLQWWHGLNHTWALGAPDVAVWALMMLDVIVVGVLATMAGSAMWHGARPAVPDAGANSPHAPAAA